MAKKAEKITRAAHIKRHTVGTSNEISFSVLDAAKNSLDDGRSDKEDRPLFGRIALFTLPGRRKKPVGTPSQEQGLPLSSGDFVSVEHKDGTAHFDTLDFRSSSASSSKSGSAKSVKAASSNMSSSAGATGAFGMSLHADGSHQTAVSAKPKRSPEEEIARRKSRRRLSKVVSLVVIGVVSVALLAFGGNYLYKDYKHQQSNVALLDDALELVKKADEDILIPLDKTVANPFGADGEKSRATVLPELDQASKYLVEADSKARETSESLRDSRDKEAANQTVATISARQTLVETGRQLLSEADAAYSAMGYVKDAWDQVLQADDKARSAATLVTDTTAENIEASKAKTNEAIEAFELARTHLGDAQVTYTDADLSPLLAYVDKRVESLGYALASDEAVLARNKEEAAAQNDLYNTADAEAVALAKELPSDPSSIISDAYEQVTADLAKSYSTARSQAGTADAFISDYLGAEVK